MRRILTSILLKLKSFVLLLKSLWKEVVSVILVTPAFNWLTLLILMVHTLIAEDIDYSLRAWFKALAYLEHLVEPDDCRIVLLYPACGNKSINYVPYSSMKHHICNPTVAVGFRGTF